MWPFGSQSKLQDLSASEVRALLESKAAILVDVREPAEFEAEHISGAMLFPLSEFDPGRLPQEPGSKIILQCGSGKRSAMAAQKMLAAGFEEAAHLAGGIMAWKQAGFPVMSRDPGTGKMRAPKA